MPLSYNGNGNFITILSGLNCTGNEASFTDCIVDSNAPTCSRNSYASVICPGMYNILSLEYIIAFSNFFNFLISLVPAGEYSTCTDGDVMLVGGDTEYEGTVHVCLNRAWGTVFPNSWNINSAQTVCNVLGYTAPGRF